MFKKGRGSRNAKGIMNNAHVSSTEEDVRRSRLESTHGIAQDDGSRLEEPQTNKKPKSQSEIGSGRDQ